MTARLFPLLLAAFAIGGCHPNGQTVSSGAKHDCVRAWNAPGNRTNRTAAALLGTGWKAEVTGSALYADGPDGSRVIRGCAVTFFAGSRFESFSGRWAQNGDLTWDAPPAHRSRLGAGARTFDANAVLHADGSIARR